MDKYTLKYTDRNINDVRHLLATHSNSAVKFQLSLRSFDDKPKINKGGINRNKSKNNSKSPTKGG